MWFNLAPAAEAAFLRQTAKTHQPIIEPVSWRPILTLQTRKNAHNTAHARNATINLIPASICLARWPILTRPMHSQKWHCCTALSTPTTLFRPFPRLNLHFLPLLVIFVSHKLLPMRCPHQDAQGRRVTPFFPRHTLPNSRPRDVKRPPLAQGSVLMNDLVPLRHACVWRHEENHETRMELDRMSHIAGGKGAARGAGGAQADDQAVRVPQVLCKKRGKYTCNSAKNSSICYAGQCL